MSSGKPRLGAKAAAILATLEKLPRGATVEHIVGAVKGRTSSTTQIVGRLRRQGLIGRTNGRGPGRPGIYAINREGARALKRWRGTK